MEKCLFHSAFPLYQDFTSSLQSPKATCGSLSLCFNSSILLRPSCLTLPDQSLFSHPLPQTVWFIKWSVACWRHRPGHQLLCIALAIFLCSFQPAQREQALPPLTQILTCIVLNLSLQLTVDCNKRQDCCKVRHEVHDIASGSSYMELYVLSSLNICVSWCLSYNFFHIFQLFNYLHVAIISLIFC